MTAEIVETPAIRIGEAATDRITVRAQLKAYTVKAASNGLNYPLAFEIDSGHADEVIAALAQGACRLWWQPDGAPETLLSEGAIPGSTAYAVKFDADGFQHHHVAFRLTRPDVERGVGVTLGLLRMPEFEQHGVTGILGIESNQMTAGL